MHDWILVSISVEWAKSRVTISFDTYALGLVKVTATDFVSLIVPKQDEWGESESVNEFEGPSKLKNGNQYLKIEMQSGDSIEIEAKCFVMPNALK